MDVEDPLGLLDRERATALCRWAGFGEVTAVQGLAASEQHASYRVDIGPRSWELRLDRLPGVCGPAADHAFAALRRLGPLGLPGPRLVLRPPTSLLGRPGLLFPHRPLGAGSFGEGDAWALAAPELAVVLEGLAAAEQPGFGLRAASGHFLGTRTSWGAAWCAHVHRLVQGARLWGTDLGRLSDRALAAVVARRAALDEVDRFTLVHGDLRPEQLGYDLRGDRPVLAGIDGWDHAFAGDPLVEVGSLLSHGSAPLAPVLAALSPGLRERWTAPAALPRIEAYTWTALLASLWRIGAISLVHGDGPHLAQLECLCERLAAALEPGAVEEALGDALARPADAPGAGDRADPGPSARASLRAVATVVRGADGLSPRVLPRYVVALAAAVLAVELEPEDRRAEKARRVAEGLVDGLRPTTVPEALEPIEDRGAWLAALVDRVPRDGPGGGLLLTWLTARVMATFGDTLSDAVLRGLEAAVLALLVLEPRPREGELDVRQQLYRAAALHGLGAEVDELLEPLQALQSGRDTTGKLLSLFSTRASHDVRVQRPLWILALRELGLTDPMAVVQAIEASTPALPRG